MLTPNRGCGLPDRPAQCPTLRLNTIQRMFPDTGQLHSGAFSDIPGKPSQCCDALTAHHDPPSLIDLDWSRRKTRRPGNATTCPRVDQAGPRPVQVPEPPVAGQREPVHTSEGLFEQIDLDRGQRRPGHRVGRDHVPGETVHPPCGGRIVRARVRPLGDESGSESGQPRRDPVRRVLAE
jgi:hypothetical protein